MSGTDKRRRGAGTAVELAAGLIALSHRISTRVQESAMRAARGADRLAGGVPGRRVAAALGRASGTMVLAAQTADETVTSVADDMASSAAGEQSRPPVPDPDAADTPQAVILTHDSLGEPGASSSRRD